MAVVVVVFEDEVAAAVVEVAVVDLTVNQKVHLIVSSVRFQFLLIFLHFKIFVLYIEIGLYQHPCESQLVCKATNDMVPYFNAGVFLENKKQIGKVDEILGPMKQYVRKINFYHILSFFWTIFFFYF